ncbi:hypothetical protein EG833_05015 [archaeon]|nr:hypothetical protein [archaeon]
MNISGIGVIQAQLLQNQKTDQSSLENTILNNTSLPEASYGKESIHMEIELKDGTKVSIDYLYEGVSKKTSYELGRYSDYSYGNDYFSSENTAKRILDFAKSLWDGSPEKLEILANAIDKGVSEARNILGTLPGWLENMVSKTVDLLHEGLEDMRAEAQEAE